MFIQKWRPYCKCSTCVTADVLIMKVKRWHGGCLITWCLTHLLLVPHICVSELGSGNGLAPNRRQAITWTNAGLFSIGSWEQFSVKLQLEFYHFDSRKCFCNCRLPKWWPFCPQGRWFKGCSKGCHKASLGLSFLTHFSLKITFS